MRFARNTAELFHNVRPRDAPEGGTIHEKDLDELPDGQAVYDPTLSAAALLVGCDRGPDRPPPTAAAPRGGPQADLSGQINAVLDVLQLGSNLLAMSDPKAAAEELPGMGHKFELFGVMVDDVDPDNATNDVISNVTTPTDLGFAFRSFPPGIQIAALDGQINLKYYFVAPRSCGGGSRALRS